jgi:ABC-type nitrate/sulfonate/bicarbonate transport system, ATPase component
MSCMIECEGVSKDFPSDKGPVPIVERLDLRVEENEFVVLFGPGQCGKTTILNIMAGLESATAGKVVVNGKSVDGPGPDRGVVYQTIALFPWYTVMQNVEYGPRMRGVPKKERREKARYFIDLVGLKGFEDSFPVQISGGMKQRVGIARAYCNEPSVLLMDEPFGALDAQTRYLMQGELERIWEKEKRTVVFVTNNVEEALYLADRIVLLKNSPTSIAKEYAIDLHRPRSLVAPEFLRLRKEISGAMDETR